MAKRNVRAPLMLAFYGCGAQTQLRVNLLGVNCANSNQLCWKRTLRVFPSQGKSSQSSVRLRVCWTYLLKQAPAVRGMFQLLLCSNTPELNDGSLSNLVRSWSFVRGLWHPSDKLKCLYSNTKGSSLLTWTSWICRSLKYLNSWELISFKQLRISSFVEEGLK